MKLEYIATCHHKFNRNKYHCTVKHYVMVFSFLMSEFDTKKMYQKLECRSFL